MPEPSLISTYLAALSAQLPAPVVEELAGGLDETRQRYLDQGLDPDAAASAALAEFGDPDVIIAAFTRLSPARRTARRLLAAGPVVGGCWGLVLAGGRAWTWPVPVAGSVLFGAALLSVIGLLAAAAFGRKYRSVRRAGAAGCLGMSTVDAAMLFAVTLTMPTLIWPVILAAGASAARLTFIARTLRPVLTG
ncbi:MAG TPA: permease prefix domain 1-containing protein [Streptosporangiaceae bacterium]|jgi:hypothetical protein|nr:permease prefix domain 1-containing protein [Streptosporangiaceae bacterium]